MKRFWLAALLMMPVASASAQGLPPGLVPISTLTAQVREDIRYASSDNFTGRPVPGYSSAQCWLRKDAAEALAKAAGEAQGMGFTIVVYDCYRPQRATDAFMRWANDDADQAMKARYYPRVEKRTLFNGGYISGASAHSTGVAIDMGFLGVDFGTPYDMFDPRSSTYAAGLSLVAAKNRKALVGLMTRHGFANYKREWWHFTFRGGGRASAYDAEIR